MKVYWQIHKEIGSDGRRKGRVRKKKVSPRQRKCLYFSRQVHKQQTETKVKTRNHNGKLPYRRRFLAPEQLPTPHRNRNPLNPIGSARFGNQFRTDSKLMPSGFANPFNQGFSSCQSSSFHRLFPDISISDEFKHRCCNSRAGETFFDACEGGKSVKPSYLVCVKPRLLSRKAQRQDNLARVSAKLLPLEML